MSGAVKSVVNVVKKVAPIAAPVVASFIPGIGPLAAAGIGAAGGLVGGGGLKGALIGGATGGLGNVAGSALGGAGGLLGNLTSAGKVLGPAAQIIQAVNSGTGNNQQSATAPRPVKAATAAPFSPLRPDAMQAPDSLGAMAGFAPEQMRSALATQGLNQGLGSQEQAYYKNLLQRSLIGDKNQVNADQQNFLSPIESQYFSRQGLDTSHVMKFLQGLQS